MPSNSFDRDVLKTAVAQICHSLGWNSMQKSSLSVLTDILERYMKKLSKTTAGFCQNSCHSDVNLNDLGTAFDWLGIQICELEDYVHQVEPIHFPKPVPQFQSDFSTAIQFPTEDEIASREEWYDEFMPPLGKKIQEDEPEIKTEEVSENSQLDLQPEQQFENIDTPLASPVTLPTKRQAENSLDNQLYLPNLVRPELPRLTPTDSPFMMKQPSFPISTPTTPILPMKREGSPLKNLEKKSPTLFQDKNIRKESPTMDDLSSKAAKRPKIQSPPFQTENVPENFKDAKVKDVSKRPEILQTLDDHSRDNYVNKNVFSPSSRDSLTSPINRHSSAIKSPASDKVSQPQKIASSPFLESNLNQPISKLEPTASLSDKKLKKAKKPAKAKSASSALGSRKSKQNAASSPQLFGSPHILKSPPEHRSIIASQTNMKGSPKTESKMDQITSPYQEKTPTTPEIKSKILHSTPYSEDTKHMKGVKKAKKQSAKKAKRKSDTSNNVEKKEESPIAAPERPQLFASLPLTKLSKHDDFKSPASITSPTMKSPKFSVAVSHSPALSSPDLGTPDAKYSASEKKKANKKEEKKRKKEKKNKKKASEEQPKEADFQKGKKHETPSLKLTFKRAPSGAYHEQHAKNTPSVMKVHGLSPAFSSPAETPTYPTETSPAKVSTPPEPKSRKQKKTKTPAEKSERKEKRPEPAVRIEPLVINEPFTEPEYEGPFDWAKDLETKKTKAPKKEGSGKKGRPPKKSDSGKKMARRKSESPQKESPKKTPKLKPSEVYQPDQFYSSPPPVTPTGEQSVSRGLFIQTITEPATTQVWYCPACLRPDDGSPMIGCDSCDGWYHWTCVGITQAPSEDVEWYCGTCVDRFSKKKIKKRKKKD